MPRVQGHVVGNGGDFRRALFSSGREHAIAVINRLTRGYFDRYAGSKIPKSDLEWVLANRKEILGDLASSDHRWGETLPHEQCPFHAKSTCGCTLPIANADVNLSYSGCENVSSVAQAGSLLLHETFHHRLGADEDRILVSPPPSIAVGSRAAPLWCRT